jgi:hypothetical protein
VRAHCWCASPPMRMTLTGGGGGGGMGAVQRRRVLLPLALGVHAAAAYAAISSSASGLHESSFHWYSVGCDVWICYPLAGLCWGGRSRRARSSRARRRRLRLARLRFPGVQHRADGLGLSRSRRVLGRASLRGGRHTHDSQPRARIVSWTAAWRSAGAQARRTLRMGRPRQTKTQAHRTDVQTHRTDRPNRQPTSSASASLAAADATPGSRSDSDSTLGYPAGPPPAHGLMIRTEDTINRTVGVSQSLPRFLSRI